MFNSEFTKNDGLGVGFAQPILWGERFVLWRVSFHPFPRFKMANVVYFLGVVQHC